MPFCLTPERVARCFKPLAVRITASRRSAHSKGVPVMEVQVYRRRWTEIIRACRWSVEHQGGGWAGVDEVNRATRHTRPNRAPARPLTKQPAVAAGIIGDRKLKHNAAGAKPSFATCRRLQRTGSTSSCDLPSRPDAVRGFIVNRWRCAPHPSGGAWTPKVQRKTSRASPEVPGR